MKVTFTFNVAKSEESKRVFQYQRRLTLLKYQSLSTPMICPFLLFTQSPPKCLSYVLLHFRFAKHLHIFTVNLKTTCDGRLLVDKPILEHHIHDCYSCSERWLLVEHGPVSGFILKVTNRNVFIPQPGQENLGYNCKWYKKIKRHGPGCSKLTKSLVHILLNFKR